MIVNDYYPVFYTDDLETETRRLTEDLGFTVKHSPKIEFLDYVVLENANKRRVDLVCSHFPADSFVEGFFGMRANVDDFDAGMELFGAQGYALFGEPHETETSITGLLTKAGREYIILFHHKG